MAACGNNLENNTLYARKALLQCFMLQPWKALPVRPGQNDQENRRCPSITDLCTWSSIKAC